MKTRTMYVFTFLPTAYTHDVESIEGIHKNTYLLPLRCRILAFFELFLLDRHQTFI